ncbi:putative F-box domain-containing protein [Helianthus annuus]|nr:putative F-box domain-containing protein [Helianthus annuus]KAJ0646187.1 putative F-box domain-containing protein [Helianthus annuus]KAJ0822841.1 putative F-box domain-containing protein [Helianthus annuus]
MQVPETILKNMVNTRPKNKKTLKTQASIEDFDHQSTQPGALIGSSDDLLTEILLRLPAASVLRFKIVSKHWHLLLSHTHFTRRYDSLFKTPGFFTGKSNTYVPFDVETIGTTPFSSLGFHFDPNGIRILQSCNGLLLCHSNLKSNADCKYYVVNPTTKQFAVIPSVPAGHDVGKTVLFMSLAFHQTGCVHYKLVCIHRVKPGVAFQIQMYSSDTGKWKVSVESFYTVWPFVSNGVYWNRALYWAPTHRKLLYFKIHVEQLEMMPLPEEMMSSLDTYTIYFGESRGHLHLIVYDYNRLCHNVYEMLSDHSGWFVKYRVDLGGLLHALPELAYWCQNRFNFSDVIRGEKEEDTFFLLLRIPGKIITFNVHDKSFNHIFNSVIKDSYQETHRYTETLASL